MKAVLKSVGLESFIVLFAESRVEKYLFGLVDLLCFVIAATVIWVGNSDDLSVGELDLFVRAVAQKVEGAVAFVAACFLIIHF